MPTAPAKVFAVLLVAQEAEGRELLQTAAETLERFGIRGEWRELPGENAGFPAAGPDGWQAVIVASADAELPGRCARASALPTLRVPVAGKGRTGRALLSDARGQLPAASGGEPFGTMAIGEAGAKNAALFIVAALAVGDEVLREKWLAFRTEQTAAVLDGPAPGMNE